MDSIGSEEPLNQRKIKLEEEKLQIERERFELERDKAKFDQRFWHRNFGTMSTFSVAFLGLVLSISQVMVAYIQKGEEIKQRHTEADIARAQRDRELLEQERKDLREFVEKREAEIHSTDETVRNNVRDLMLSSFDPEVVKPVVEALHVLAPQAQKQTWTQAQNQIASVILEDAKPVIYFHYQDQRDAKIIEKVMSDLREAGYRVPSKQLVTQFTKGDIRYFHTAEKEQAVAIANIVSQAFRNQGRDQSLTPIYVGATFPKAPSGLFEVWLPTRAE